LEKLGKLKRRLTASGFFIESPQAAAKPPDGGNGEADCQQAGNERLTFVEQSPGCAAEQVAADSARRLLKGPAAVVRRL
jgi:hypothetical protein